MNKIYFLGFITILATLAGCEKNDHDIPFGITNIYMPQATVSGGTPTWRSLMPTPTLGLCW